MVRMQFARVAGSWECEIAMAKSEAETEVKSSMNKYLLGAYMYMYTVNQEIFVVKIFS